MHLEELKTVLRASDDISLDQELQWICKKGVDCSFSCTLATRNLSSGTIDWFKYLYFAIWKNKHKKDVYQRRNCIYSFL